MVDSASQAVTSMPDGAARDDSAARAANAYLAFSDRLSSLPEPDDALRALGRELCEVVGATRCSVYVPMAPAPGSDRDGLRFTCRVAGREDLDDRVRGLVAGGIADGFTAEIVATRRPVMIDDAARDPRPIRATMRRWNVSSMLGVPVVCGPKIEAVVFLDHATERLRVDAQHLEVAERFARLAAPTIRTATAAASLRGAHARSRMQALTASRALAISDRLWGCVGGDDDGSMLLDATASALQRPVVAYGPGWTSARAFGVVDGGGASIPALDDPAVLGSARFRARIAAVGPGDCVTIDPAPDLGVHRRVLVAPVDDPTGRTAWLVAIDSSRRLGSLDAQVLRRAAHGLATIGRVEQRMAQASEVSPEHAVAQLLVRGGTAAARRGVRALGLAADDDFVVAIAAERDGVPVDREVYDAVVAGMAGEGCVVAPHETSIVVLWALGDDASPESARDRCDRLERMLRTVPLAGDVVVGVSRAVTGAERIADAGEDAAAVVAALRRFGEPGGRRALAADELGPLCLLLATADVSTTRGFADRVLGVLGDQRGRHRDLLATMQAFFAAARQVRGAASLLDVHPNTVRYRMARVRELTGLAILGSAHDQASAELALALLVLRGELGPPPAAVRADP